MTDEPKTQKQCPSCPWKVDCVPTTDIPNYVPQLHEGLIRTIARDPTESMFCRERHVMACHYSKPGEEFPCAGWLANQIGPGNNIGARLMVLSGKWLPPETEGPQHETFEQTLCRPASPGATHKASSTRRSSSTRSGSRRSVASTSGGTTQRTPSRSSTRTKA